MSDSPTKHFEIELAHLNKRLKRLAEEKSFLQLANSLFSRLIRVSGIEERENAILQGLTSVIGGTYLALYYQIDDVMHFCDINGVKRRLIDVDDALVRSVLRSGTPVEKEEDFAATRMLTNEFYKASTWVYPLKVDNEVIGAIRIDHLNLSSQSLAAHLSTLFSYIALCLQTEILGQSRLKQANDELKLEIERRRNVEEKLEVRVAERTAALKRQKMILEASQSLAHIGGWEWDVATQALYWTDETYRIHGLEPPDENSARAVGDELITTSIQCYRPEDRARILTAFRACADQGEPYDLEFSFHTYHGHERWIRTTARAVRERGEITSVLGNILDITAQKNYEKERLKIEKLESLGLLAGGIAHDFNNALTGILGHLTLSKRRTDPDHPARKSLEKAEEACAKAAKLANQLLTFARGGEPVKKNLSLAALLNEWAVAPLLGSNVKVTVEIADDLAMIEADAEQLAQVVNQLVINAREAMPNGGTLHLSATNMQLEANNPQGVAAGNYVQLVFTDQGEGIAEQNLPRIFDPYFTTKKTGHGLGLASAHSIIKRHQGHIAARCAAGQGATFTIYLPSTEPRQQPTPIASRAVPPAPEAGAKILVMDDEALIRELVAEILEMLGYQPTCTVNGSEALNCYQAALAAGQPFALAIMDLTIPGGMGGKETAAQIRAIDPSACLIVSSGYSDDPVMANYQDYGFCAAVAKPYQITELEDCLARLTCRKK